MSDLGRLFRLRSTPDQEPLENFTTVALAIAIGHDPRPMSRALRAVDWTYQGADGHPAVAMLDVAAADIVTVSADTQVMLQPAQGIALGYLDLVLYVGDSQHRKAEIWVEVKVDAWESGTQLTNYRMHAALRSPSPAILTLGRLRISSQCPCLKWSDLVGAIASESGPHHTWLSLREFLLHERIVRPPVPTEPIDTDQTIDVITDINQRLRGLWPNTGTALAWRDGDLRNSLKKCVREGQDLVTTGGPLRYGLMPAGTGWQWGLVVTTKNEARISLDAQQMLRDADVGGLPQDWLRHTDRFEVLERRLSPERLASHDEIVRWFDEGFQQLRDARILDRYLKGLTRKHST